MLLEGAFAINPNQETALIALALICAVRIRFWDSTPGFSAYTTLPDFGVLLIVFVATLQMCFYYGDLYNLRHTQLRNERLMAVAQSLGGGLPVIGNSVLCFFLRCYWCAAYFSQGWP